MKTYRTIAGWTPLFLIMVVAAVALAVGQKTPDENWQTYAPDKKLFSMKIPGAPAPAQGGFFETDDEKIAHRFFSGGIKSRVFNFEIMKAKDSV